MPTSSFVLGEVSQRYLPLQHKLLRSVNKFLSCIPRWFSDCCFSAVSQRSCSLHFKCGDRVLIALPRADPADF